MLSFVYRLLTRAGKRDEVTLDMIDTFEKARADALSRGRWSYLTFAIREIFGLLGSPGRLIPKTKWILIPVGGLVGLALGVAASHLWPLSYTTEGVLLIHIGQIDQDPISSGSLDIDHTLSEAKSTVLSTYRILRFLEQSGLYPHLRARKDFWAMHEELNKAVRIERSGDYTVRVTCTYRDYPPGADDARKAAILVNLLGNQLIETTLIEKETQVNDRVEYFRERSESVARSWEELNARIRLSAKDPRLDRLTLDRDLARKEYESLREKLNEAEGLSDLELRQRLWRLGWLDPAPVPEKPDISPQQIALSGFAGGIVIGSLAWLVMFMRGVRPVLLTPEVAASD